MAGKPWTDERRAAHAAAIRAKWADPDYRAKQAASQTPERRAASRKRAKKLWRRPGFRRQRSDQVRADMANPARRATNRTNMMKLVIARRENEAAYDKWAKANRKSCRTRARREMARLVFSEIRSRPEVARACSMQCRRMNRDPKIRRKQVIGRGHKPKAVPKGRRNSETASPFESY